MPEPLPAGATVALLRVAAQRLAGRADLDAVEAVRWLTALQGQDFAGALTSVALRTASGTRAEVTQALDDGAIVRSWPMRGTLHLLLAEDLAWMLGLLAARVLRVTEGRRAGLGLDDDLVRRAGDSAAAALEGGHRLTRRDLFARWESDGVPTSGQRGVHLLRFHAMTGLLVLGPTQGREQLVVLLGEWVPRPRTLERDEALAELTLRYFRSHGPATTTDFARWANLVATDVRAGVAAARPFLECLVVGGVDYLMDPGTPARLASAEADARALRLLPGFDELLLGYTDRSPSLDPAYADAIVPGGNGMFRSTVVHDGRVIGTWRRAGTAARPRIAAEPLMRFSAEIDAALPGLFAELP